MRILTSRERRSGKTGLETYERRKMINREGIYGRLDKKTSVPGNGTMQHMGQWEKGDVRDEESGTGMRSW